MSGMTTGEMLREERKILEPQQSRRRELYGAAGPVGLSLSGGGIRSATFALGFLQALAKLRLLTAFDYLSTVSGGGYIGSWLSAWIHRHPEGFAGVMIELAGPHPSAEADVPSRDPEAVRHLRRFSNYLTPHVGLLSTDTWALAGTFLRNLLVNLLTLVPYFALLLLFPILGTDLLVGLTLGLPGPWARLGAYLYAPTFMRGVGIASLVLLAVSISVVTVNLPRGRLGSARGRRAAGPTGAGTAGVAPEPGEGMTERGFLMAAFIPLTVASIGLASYWFLVSPLGSGTLPWRPLVGAGIVVHLMAFAFYALRVLQSKRTGTPLRLALSKKKVPLDLLAIAASGAVGGWLVWLLGNRLGDFAQSLADVLHIETPLDVVFLYRASFLTLAVPTLFATFLLAMTLYLAMASRCMSDDDREWYARAGSWLMMLGLAWCALSALALFGPFVVHGTARVALTGLLNLASGAVTWWLGRGAETSGRPAPGQRGSSRTERMLLFAAAVFVLAFLLLLATALTGLRDHLVSTYGWERVTASLVIAVGLVLAIVIVIGTVDVNVFSLHAMYRDRLVRAYLGASRTGRRWNRFTGFDPHDDVPLAHLAAPYFSVSDWPLVYAMADRLSATGEHREIDTIDADLIAATLEVPSFDPAVIEPLIGRWNEIVSRQADPAGARDQWDRMLADTRAAGPFGLQDWRRIRAIPRGVDDETARAFVSMDATLLEDIQGQTQWSAAAVRQLVRRCNACLGSGAGVPIHLEIPPLPVAPPLHIMNAALNLVTGEELAWQERKAAFFTLTPLHAGSSVTGFRRMHATPGNGGVTLGTAMAISGAAANPKMGCHSSPIVTFLLTLLNGRLGVWTGNPRNDRTWRHSHPQGFRLFPMPLLEAFGQTTSRGDYINLSDGGHVENLGLYELVRRGCRYIVALDAGADEHYAFEDLGNAIRKIRVDLGVDITFEGFRIGEAEQTKYLALGQVKYEDRPFGELLYVKPIVRGRDEPIDVQQYHRCHPAYPQESTVDQWFTESQFESYRALGEYIALAVGTATAPRAADTDGSHAAGPKPADVDKVPKNVEELFTRARAYVAAANPG